MARKFQYQILVDYLYSKGGEATLRDIHLDTFIQNVPDAAMRARKKGYNITTEYKHDNPKIATYVLHQKAVQTVFPEAVQGEVVSEVKAFDTKPLLDVPDQPTKTRAYHE